MDHSTGQVDPLSLVVEAEFYGLSGPAAAYKMLEKVGRPNTLRTNQLVAALRKGGIAIKNPTSLYTSMDRNPRFKRVGKGLWGLTEWYPASSRPPGATVNPQVSAGGASDTGPETEERPDEIA